MTSISSSSPLSSGSLPFDSDMLAGKQNGGSQDLLKQSAGDGSSAINFGQSGSAGTSLESLLNNKTPDNGSQGQNGDISQAVAQLMAEIMKAILPLLQQLLQGQQSGGDGDSGNSGTQAASGNSGGTSAAAGDGGGTQGSPNGDTTSSPAIPVLSKAETQGSGTGDSSSAASNSSSTTSASGSTPALSTSSGGDLHLPDSLKPYESDIQDAAQATGVPANVLAAQIWQESRGSLGASTVNGGNGLQDAGLMQVNSNTFADLQSKNPDLLGANANPNNAHDNIMAGALYMKEQLNSFDGNMGAALRAYNSGPNNVNTSDLSDISKTGTGDSTYVDKVMDFANTIATGKGTLPA